MTGAFGAFELTTTGWLLAALCGMLTGIAKTGLSGASMLAVPVMAELFGGRASAGLVLPMLITADMFGVGYYHRHASWRHVLKLLPWTFAGIIAGTVFGSSVPDSRFKQMIGIIILASIVVMLWQEHRRVSGSTGVPDDWWFAALMGLAGGFATMAGNAAGPVMAVYLLSMRLPRDIYIGTGAWFFMIVNLTKVPFHLFIWHTITLSSLSFNLLMVPAIAIGAFTGFRLVRHIPEKPYRIVIMAMTAAAAIRLFW